MKSHYYDLNADLYCTQTGHLDLSSIYREFLPLIPNGGHILDAGCGSGRDSHHFLTLGYKVTAFDGSVEMAKRAQARIGQTVLHQTFSDVSWSDRFHGIWAQASLLHVPSKELSATMKLLVRALKCQGAFFFSFKFGSFEGIRGERHYTDRTERQTADLIASLPAVRLQKQWTTHDVRPGRENEVWLNTIVTKTDPSALIAP